jgi:hypothetical protein
MHETGIHELNSLGGDSCFFLTYPRDYPVKADTAEAVEGERTVSQDGSHAQSRVRAPFGHALRCSAGNFFLAAASAVCRSKPSSTST